MLVACFAAENYCLRFYWFKAPKG